MTQRNMPSNPSEKKPFTVNLSITFSIPRTYPRLQAKNKEEALDMAIEQLSKDMWGVKDVEVVSITEV